MDTGHKVFEDLLKEHIRFNNGSSILPTETTICRRLLDRRPELADACDELWAKLDQNRFFLSVFTDGFLGAAAVWNPQKMVDARLQRDRLEKVNERISVISFELADLLRERSDLHDHSGFASETHYHVVEVINDAARQDHRFNSYVREPLKHLRGQFDLKYWPSLPDIVSALAADAAQARTVAHNALTAAGTASSRPSLTDFFRAWFEFIEENSDGRHLPCQFKLSDASYASLANCALDLGPNKIVGAEYVKRLRQRIREAEGR
ncbi:hypothetical protein [Sinorhizobium meliloti]|uniref:hypothetical protein n=1 Tax=Rhizobium meliloti TaxID=382 RepID=UPI0003639000|nr:hypothetical protein [Sinorhizobium meliloti]